MQGHDARCKCSGMRLACSLSVPVLERQERLLSPFALPYNRHGAAAEVGASQLWPHGPCMSERS